MDITSPTRCIKEPIIEHLSVPREVKIMENGSRILVNPEADARRGDIAVNGWWNKANIAVFDVVVKHTNAPSYVIKHKNPKDVLRMAEKDKKRMYSKVCSERRLHFTPFAISADGMFGTEANMLLKIMARKRAEQLAAPYSVILNWIKTQLSFDLVRGNFRCLYGKRIPWFLCSSSPRNFEESAFYHAHVSQFQKDYEF